MLYWVNYRGHNITFVKVLLLKSFNFCQILCKNTRNLTTKPRRAVVNGLDNYTDGARVVLNFDGSIECNINQWGLCLAVLSFSYNFLQKPFIINRISFPQGSFLKSTRLLRHFNQICATNFTQKRSTKHELSNT